MSQRPTDDLLTGTIERCWAAGSADGRTALVLKSPQFGTIAYELDQQRIDALRKHLSECEALLHRSGGQA